jgi:hypothetical protein
MTVRLPAGLSIDLRGVGVCQASRLRSRGGAGCVSGSRIGRGEALLEVHAGSQTLPEDAAVSVFRGPSRGGRPTFEILGHGETPLDESTISTAVLALDSAPNGLKLVVAVPRRASASQTGPRPTRSPGCAARRSVEGTRSGRFAYASRWPQAGRDDTLRAWKRSSQCFR